MGTMGGGTGRYAGPRKTGTPTRSECPYKGCGMGAVELRGAGEREIVLLGLRGEQDPDGVDTEGGAEGNVQELEEAEDHEWRARPRLVLQAAPSAGAAG